MSLKKTQAAKIIEEHFRYLSSARVKGDDVPVSAREAGRRMVEIYRLLTGEMPQAAGIEEEYHGDELPGVEFPSPLERDPNEVFYVHPGQPDILIPGDQHGNDQKSITEERPREVGGRRTRRLLGPHRD